MHPCFLLLGGNDLNDRLPGYTRNAFTGPDHATTDLRLTRTIRLRKHYKLNRAAEWLNLLNLDNQRVAITSNGMVANEYFRPELGDRRILRRTPVITNYPTTS